MTDSRPTDLGQPKGGRDDRTNCLTQKVEVRSFASMYAHVDMTVAGEVQAVWFSFPQKRADSQIGRLLDEVSREIIQCIRAHPCKGAVQVDHFPKIGIGVDFEADEPLSFDMPDAWRGMLPGLALTALFDATNSMIALAREIRK